jgi:hypothetical protein
MHSIPSSQAKACESGILCLLGRRRRSWWLAGGLHVLKNYWAKACESGGFSEKNMKNLSTFFLFMAYISLRSF